MPFEKQLAHLDDTERTPERIGGSLPLQILNVAFWIATIVIAIITSSGGFGWSYGSLFEYFRTHITAAHWVNIIWFVIYFLGLVFVIYQVFPYQRNNSVLFRRINFLFILSCIINIVWNIVYSYGHFWAAAALITALLIVLSIIYCSVNIGLKRATAPLEYLCVHLFFSVYLAWVAYLTFQNWAQAAKWHNDENYDVNWRGEGWNQRGWAILWLCINALFTLLILAIRRDIAYGLAFSFIYFAIGSKQRRYLNVSNCAYILAGIFVLLSLIAGAIKLALWLKERKNREVVVVAHPNDRQTAAVANPVVVKEGHPNVAGAIPATGATGPAMGATPYPASGVPTRMV